MRDYRDEDHLEEWRRQEIDDAEYLREIYKWDESDWDDEDPTND